MAYCQCLGCMEVFDYGISTICPHCGYDQNTGKKKLFHLDPGTELEGKYTIGKTIGSGSFAITYVAWDSVLAKKIAVKEYLPTDFATRSSTSKDAVPYDDSEKSYQYEMGLNSFVKEAHTLAQLNKNDGIVHIYDTFIENNTAYIVMEFVSGTKLSDILKTSEVMPYRDIINLLVPSMKVLDTIHNQGVVHRDIAPDNIIKTETGARLIDFGTARHSTSLEGEHSIFVLLKPGYAPQEQYSTHGNQGAWTDVYAMAAVIYHMITGKIPPESVKRLQKDEIIPPSAMGVEIDSNVEAVLMKALSVQIEDRYQTMGEFAEALEDALPALEESVPPPVISKKDDTYYNSMCYCCVGGYYRSCHHRFISGN
ncbi:MAG: serine/threonine protein kinase [Clostridiales bacterium]|nr:serine/threonine protein kinase [Clostridiales bacterium]